MIRHRPSVHFGVTHATLCDPGRPYVRLAFEPHQVLSSDGTLRILTVSFL